MKGKRLLALCLVGVMLLLGACGASPEEVQSYAQAVLDAGYKGEFAEYAKQTKTSEEEAKAIYEENLDQMMTQAGFASMELPEELKENYRTLFQDMLKKADYKVGKAKEGEEKSFTVEVTVKPLIAFEGLQEEVTAKVQEEMAGFTEALDSVTVNEMVFRRMYEIMEEKMKEPAYGEPQTLTLRVSPDENQVYEISEADLSKLDLAMFPFDNL